MTEVGRRLVVVRRWLMVVAVVPFVVMAVVQRRPRWVPVLDQATIEMLVRDVGTADIPMTGTYGRFPVDGLQASHPGPFGWYLLWPIYRLLGSTSFALTVAYVTMHALAVIVLIWVVSRRRRTGVLLLFAVAAMVLARGYGTFVLSQVWNPHLPVLWWLAFACTAWGVLCGDRFLLPVMTAIGALCVQTHVSYLGPVAVVGVIAVVGTVVDGWRHPELRSAAWRWLGFAAAVGVVLWLPPIYDQVAHDDGNLGLLWTYFTSGENVGVGWGQGVELLSVHLDPWRMVVGHFWGDRQSDIGAMPMGSVVPGILMAAVWVGSAGVSLRLGDRDLVRFHAITAAALAAGVVSISRVVPPTWYWVMFWGWGLSMMVLVAVVWTGAVLASRYSPEFPFVVAARVAAAAVMLTAAVVFIAETATGPRLGDYGRGQALGQLLPPTLAALESDPRLVDHVGPYRVNWSDPVWLGVQGFALINELERAGFDVGTELHWLPEVRSKRVLAEGGASASIRLVGGIFIDQLRADPSAIELAYYDARTATERGEYEEARSDLIVRLRATGQTELIREVDSNTWALKRDDLDAEIKNLADELIELGVAQAIFYVPTSDTA